MEGFLGKKSPSVLAGWQDRFLVLEDGKLRWFKSNQEKDLAVPEGVINMEHFEIILEIPNDNPDGLHFNLRFNGIGERIFEFRAKTREDAEEWQLEL